MLSPDILTFELLPRLNDKDKINFIFAAIHFILSKRYHYYKIKDSV